MRVLCHSCGHEVPRAKALSYMGQPVCADCLIINNSHTQGEHNMSEITEDQWATTYKPQTNHLRPDSSWLGCMYETYGDEADYVFSLPEEKVWTYIDGDNGTFLVAGRTYVNRIGYLVCEVPWKDFFWVDLTWAGETCDQCGVATDNGAGHFQEELGNDHPQAEDRLCTECYENITTKENI